MQFIELGGPVGGVVDVLGEGVTGGVVAGAVLVVGEPLGLGEAVVPLGPGLADGDPDGLGDALGATIWHLLAYVPSAATVAGSQTTMAPGVAAYGSPSAAAMATPDPPMMTPAMTVAQATRSQLRSRPDPLGVAR
jgi:hypothetical protein